MALEQPTPRLKDKAECVYAGCDYPRKACISACKEKPQRELHEARDILFKALGWTFGDVASAAFEVVKRMEAAQSATAAIPSGYRLACKVCDSSPQEPCLAPSRCPTEKRKA